MNNKMVGTFIAISRHENGWTQSEFAKSLNISNKTVSKWETGRGLPDVTMFPAIAKVLSVTVVELMQGYKDIKEDKLELTAISDLDTVELMESMSEAQKKTIKQKILNSFCASCIALITKLAAALSIVAIVVISILFGAGIISVNNIKKTPNAEDFECLFFATQNELETEYNLNEKLNLSFDFAIRNKKGVQYDVKTPVVDVKEIVWYRHHIFYYTIKHNNGKETIVNESKTGKKNTFNINSNYNYMNNTVSLAMAGTTTITGYSEFIINDKTFKYSDSITIKVNPIKDTFIGDYLDVPKFVTNGHFIKTNNIIFWGDEIANFTQFSHTTVEEYNAYKILLINQGYSYRQVVKEEKVMQIYENEKYKIYTCTVNGEYYNYFYRYVVIKISP